jgi:signal transduction histidine kinase
MKEPFMQTDDSLISSERSPMFAAALLFRVGAVVVIAATVAIRQPLPEWMTDGFRWIAAPLFVYNLAALLWRKRIESLLARHPWLLAVDLAISVALLTGGCGWRNAYFVYTLTTPILFTIFLKRRGAWAAAAVFVGTALIKDPVGNLPVVEIFGLTHWDLRVGAALFYLATGLVLGYFDTLLSRIERLAQEKIAETQRRVTIEEQHRLALELHDGAKQMVTALLLRSHALLRRKAWDETVARSELEWLWRGMSYLQTELTHLVSAFQGQRQGQPAGWSVADIVREEIRLMEILTGSHWKPVLFDEGKTALSLRQRDALRHFVSEALMNAWKHAGVADGTVELRLRHDEFVLGVCDHGCGFDPEAAGTLATLGLHSLQYRARELGGRLDLVSAPGQGCCLTLRFPAHPQDDASADPNSVSGA